MRRKRLVVGVLAAAFVAVAVPVASADTTTATDARAAGMSAKSGCAHHVYSVRKGAYYIYPDARGKLHIGPELKHGGVLYAWDWRFKGLYRGGTLYANGPWRKQHAHAFVPNDYLAWRKCGRAPG